jgi:hypothetical protein
VSWTVALTLVCALAGCSREPQKAEVVQLKSESTVSILNEKVRNHAFLQCMYDDGYFPNHLVDKGKQILIQLCEQIEKDKPADVSALYVLTHAATEKFNDLEAEFLEADSEIETGARECIGSDFSFIAEAYGFADADTEELIATRDW